MIVKSNVFPEIKNNSNFILKTIPNYHPQSLKYSKFWHRQVKRVFEGCWIPDTHDLEIDLAEELNYTQLAEQCPHDWVWMPPQLYFYLQFGTILHRPEGSPRTMPKKKIRPQLSDFELAFAFNWIEARGFSGFEDDEEYTCNRDFFLYQDGKIDELPESCFRPDGSLKTYMPARLYLRLRRDKPYGRPLYWNEARNLMLLGTRGGGKSFFASVGIVLHSVITDGALYYNQDYIKNPPMNEIFVGSGIAAKSSEFLAKTKDAMDNLPGAWRKGFADEEPSPLFKHMKGTLQPNNMKNPWRHKYDIKVGGEWKLEGGGSGTNVKHGVITTENPEVSAGGRYSVTVVEEVGLTGEILTFTGSNDATMRTDGTDKYGSELDIGTGGNMEKIIGAELKFRDPKGFEMLEFDDEWENTGKICWFVPAVYADRKFKDKEGNTILDKAYENYENRREDKKQAKTSTALDLEMMNYPLKPSEMFLNKSNNNYPMADLKHRLAELLTSDKLLNSSFRGHFEMNEDGGIKWKNTDELPIREYPLRSDKIDGCVEMFYQPIRLSDNSIPYGRYIAALDPIDDDDNQDANMSLQSFFIFDLWTDRIVLEYSARTKFAKDFYEQCRRACLYYNAMLLYENQKKGVFTYFDTKNSLYLLEDAPPELRDMDMQKISTVGNKSKGVYATPMLNKWGRQELGPAWMNSQALGYENGVTNAMVQRSVGLIRECIFYNPETNADRVTALGLLMIFREIRSKYVPKSEEKKKPKPSEDPFWDRNYGYKSQKHTQ